MEQKAAERISRATRLRTLKGSLVHLLVEIKDLDMGDLDKLLGAAALAVDDALDDVNALSREAHSSRRMRGSRQ